jgi:hypothetical protein
MSARPSSTPVPQAVRDRLDVDRRQGLTRDEMEREYLSPPGRPVIITDVVGRWPAYGKWTFEYLADRFGDQDIVVRDRYQSGGRPGAGLAMKLRTYMQYCEDPTRLPTRITPRHPFYFAFEAFSGDSELLADFTWPEAIDNLYSTLGPQVYDWFLRYNAVLLIGPAGTVTPLHEDLFGTHAFLAQFVGRKRAVFFPPDVRLDKPSAISTRLAGLPEIARDDAPAYETVVSAGEMLVFPRGWRHEVTSLDPSISLSINFVNGTNLVAHMLEIFRDLPAWAARLNAPGVREALAISWQAKDFDLGASATS